MMSRIRIDDLPLEKQLDTDELKSIFGAGLTPESIDSARRLVDPQNRPPIHGLPSPLDDPHCGQNPFLKNDESDPIL
jgi:hypothetical protein